MRCPPWKAALRPSSWRAARTDDKTRTVEACRARLLGAHRRISTLLFHGARFDALRTLSAQRDDVCILIPKSRPEHAEAIGWRHANRCERVHDLSRYVWHQENLIAETFRSADQRPAVRIQADFVNADRADADVRSSEVRHVLVAQSYVERGPGDVSASYTLYYDDMAVPILLRDLKKEGFLARLRRDFWSLMTKGKHEGS